MSQNTDILNHLQKGPITTLEALNKYGCFRLASRINDLRRQGHEIITTNKELPNGKHVAEYSLKPRQGELDV